MKRVAVVGSGPAGMAAAYALAKAGFKVTVFEKSSMIGGKVTSHNENGFSQEHGVHGWWNNYINFTAIIKDCGLDETQLFKKVEGTTMVTPSGKKYNLNVLKWKLPSPLFMILQMVTAPFLKIGDVFSMIRFGIVLFGFDQKTDYEKYDKLSFQELMDECKVSPAVQSLMLTPFILSFDFTVPSRVSAGCGLSGLHFYVIRDQLSVCTRWLKGTPNEMIFNPMRNILTNQYGVVFITSCEVERLEVGHENACITGCVVKSSTLKSEEAQLIARIQTPEIVEGTFHKLSGFNILIGRKGENYIAFDSTCSHNGCSVFWNNSQMLFECPCHGGKYHPDGNVHSGPPPQPLQQLLVVKNEDFLTIKSPQVSKTISFDEVILATDVVNAKNIMSNTLPATHSINRNLTPLDTTPVIVVRIWFEGKNYEPTIDSALTPEFDFIDNYFNLNSFSDRYDREGHVVEVQAYRVFSDLEKTDSEILQRALNDLAIINSNYKRERVLQYRINRHKQLFTRYAPRLNAHRPTERSGIDGLYFAGDWTGFYYPVWMMERGICSGIRAANAISRKYKQNEFPLVKLDEGSLLFRVTKASCRFILKLQEANFLKSWQHLAIRNPGGQVTVLQRKKDDEGLYIPKPANTSWWDWTVFLLHTAAEVEHSLMIQYLFSGYSINPRFGSAEYDMVSRWKGTVLKIAVEEMGHLLAVQTILKLIGGPLNFEREDYPYRSDLYPFPFELRKFDKQSIARFVIAELPSDRLDEEQKEILKFAGITLYSNQINNIGLLYEDIIHIFSDGNKLPESHFDFANKGGISSYWSFSPDFICEEPSTRALAIDILKKIAEQGEGTSNQKDSHFERFISIYREFDSLDLGSTESLAVNVDANPSLKQGAKNRITEPRAVLWAEIHNIKYQLTLSLLSHSLQMQHMSEQYVKEAQKNILGLIHREMAGRGGVNGLKQISERIFSLPLVDAKKFSLRAGPCFDLPLMLNIPDTELARWQSYSQLYNQQLTLLNKLVKYDSEHDEATQCISIVKKELDLIKAQIEKTS
ncbi:FAD-dependent oxidoreductase [Algoriphagus terrigena]|uniref:FAD-dependent oxidoreductase n=1 Tax=Algoriphagus terrigena TaxID=344884 RepID=UPI0003F71C48